MPSRHESQQHMNLVWTTTSKRLHFHFYIQFHFQFSVSISFSFSAFPYGHDKGCDTCVYMLIMIVRRIRIYHIIIGILTSLQLSYSMLYRVDNRWLCD